MCSKALATSTDICGSIKHTIWILLRIMSALNQKTKQSKSYLYFGWNQPVRNFMHNI